jgi:hypothetical protein
MPKKAQPKKITFGADLIEGMKLVLAHGRGKIELEQVWPKQIDAKALRKGVKMSQAEFSRCLWHHQTRLAGVGGRRTSARLDRTRLSNCHRERTSRSSPGTRQRIARTGSPKPTPSDSALRSF